MKATSKQLIAALVVACMAIALTACGGAVEIGSSIVDVKVSGQVEKPTIDTQPANQSVATGSAATFTVIAASGGALTYQWKKNGMDIPGATFSTYTTPATRIEDSGAVFTVVLGNNAGSITSREARLTITAEAEKPAIGKQPESLSVLTGTPASFSVSATGTAPFSYQWKKNGADIPGATSSTYTTPATSNADNDAVFTVTVSNSAGIVTSNQAKLTITATAMPPSITSQPEAKTVNAGQSASFSVTASGTSPIYQWKKNGTDIPDATSSTYTTPATSIADNDAVFVVVVSNSEGHVTSSEARLTVTAVAVAPTITSQPATQTVAPDKTATFTVTASGTGTLHYQWQKFGADIPDAADSNSYTTPKTTKEDTGDVYSVVVRDDVGTVTSSTATLTVSQYSRIVKANGGRYELTECVKDNGSGLVWEGKTETGNRAGSHTYTHFDNTSINQKFDVNVNAAPTRPTQNEVDASNNTMGYINEVNDSGLCGYTDWRLPTKLELLGIRDADQTSAPQIDKTWFFNTQDGSYWTSSPWAYDLSAATVIYFSSAFISGGGNRSTLTHHVRLVRGNP